MTEGIQNFNLKKVFLAGVSSEGRGHSGNNFYDNFEEARIEALEILEQEFSDFEKEVAELRIKYDVR